MKALVLSGGGSKGAYQLGVLKRWMGEQEKDYKIITGVSVGALNAAHLSQTPYGKPKEAIDNVIDFWLKRVDTKNIYKRWFPFGRLHSLWLDSVYDSTPLIELVKENIDLKAIRSSGREVSVGAVNLNTGEHKFATADDEDFVDWVLASSSFPVFLKPITIGGQKWSDGGIKNVTPLGQAIKMGATEIDVIITDNIWESRVKELTRALPDQLLRAIDLMSEQIMRNDIKVTGLKNDLADFVDKYRRVKVNVVMPDDELIGNSLDFDPKQIKRMIEAGYKDADNIVVYK